MYKYRIKKVKKGYMVRYYAEFLEPEINQWLDVVTDLGRIMEEEEDDEGVNVCQGYSISAAKFNIGYHNNYYAEEEVTHHEVDLNNLDEIDELGEKKFF